MSWATVYSSISFWRPPTYDASGVVIDPGSNWGNPFNSGVRFTDGQQDQILGLHQRVGRVLFNPPSRTKRGGLRKPALLHLIHISNSHCKPSVIYRHHPPPGRPMTTECVFAIPRRG